VVSAVLAAAGAVALWWMVRHYEAGLPSVADLKTYQAPQVTRVLARDGTVLAELFTQRRTVVSIASLPPHVKLAVLAAEDAGFYEHEGLNYLGIGRALLVNLRAGTTRQGGSTITQQVVKNLLLNTHERTFSRKVREALLARRLEQELTKDEILELYLNNIYFGRGRYGIEEAARDDFGKSARDLDIAEAALIAGRIADPRDYSPRASMNLALARRGYVTVTGKGSRAEPIALGRWRWPLAIIGFAYLGVAVVLPFLALLLIALRRNLFFTTLRALANPAQYTVVQFATAFGDPVVRQALANSLLVAVATVGLGGILYFAVAYTVHRTEARGRRALDISAYAERKAATRSFPTLAEQVLAEHVIEVLALGLCAKHCS